MKQEVGMTVEGKLRAAIVGSTGYGGVELIRLLQNHPDIEVTSVISSSSAGEPIENGFPHLTGIIQRNLDGVDPAEIAGRADVVFTATPSGVSAKLVPQLLEAGLKVVDLSGDFRLKDGAEYEQWYKHPAPLKLTWSRRSTAYVRYSGNVPPAWILSLIRAVILRQHCWG